MIKTWIYGTVRFLALWFLIEKGHNRSSAGRENKYQFEAKTHAEESKTWNIRK